MPSINQRQRWVIWGTVALFACSILYVPRESLSANPIHYFFIRNQQHPGYYGIPEQVLLVEWLLLLTVGAVVFCLNADWTKKSRLLRSAFSVAVFGGLSLWALQPPDLGPVYSGKPLMVWLDDTSAGYVPTRRQAQQMFANAGHENDLRPRADSQTAGFTR